ncbi:hypothetical protein J5N97_014504 [Dioscorea zingiberensis]|uniref:Oligopeptide transporter n=1 Tax=Dioscorea zingiberensis TaxID=325984 RepID=A0A9D5CVF0_9LILI|nr:hypothetical protein J5N97_014504 [Dioscorea zingiberensis]
MGKNQKTQTSSSSSVAENNEPAESPVEQVRHTVPTTDDPTIPALTFRTWVLGVSACLIIYPSTSFFVFRQNPLFFSSTLTQIIMLPLGRLMASSLPKRLVRIPWLGFSFSLNPGPFSIKEHLLANTIAWGGYPSSLLIITSKRVFFSQDLNILPSFMMIMSTQVYNVSRVLNPETNQLDLEAYNNYSKLYQSISFVFKSGFEFAALVASIVHVALLDGRSVWQQFIQAYKDEGTAGDVHNHLMRKYKAIPSWWYYSIIVISLGLGFAICEVFAGVLFHVVVLRRFGNEWIDKGYLLSAALDAGSIIAGFVISASLQLPAGVYGLSWWGLDFDDHCPLASCPTVPDVNVPGCPTI